MNANKATNYRAALQLPELESAARLSGPLLQR